MIVRVFALSTCPWCKKVKELLDTEKIIYDVLDVDLLQGAEQEQAVAEVEKLTGKRSFPVTVVGEQVFIGFKKDEILEAIRLGAAHNEK